MSVTDPTADPAQPEGQGGEASGGSPWESYLDRFPEEVRDTAADAFREMEGNATKRFQEHSEYRKSWEPYEQLGVNQQDPQALQWALQLAELAQGDPQGFKQWYEGYAQQNGLQANAVEDQPAGVDEFNYQDPQQQLESLLEQRLSPFQQQLEQISSRFEQQEEQARQQEASQFIEGQLAELAKTHGDEFDREAVELFLPHFVEQARTAEDLKRAVPQAFEMFQTQRNKWQKAAFQSKVDAPAPAEGGGVPDMSTEKPKTISEVRASAVEFLRNGNRAGRGL